MAVKYRLLVLLIVGCGGEPSAKMATPSVLLRDAAADETTMTSSDVDPSVPADLRTAIERVQRVGRVLYSLDEPAALATDVALACGARKDVRGYVALPAQGGGWEVVFVTRDAPVSIGYRVTLAPHAKPTCDKLDPPEPASEAYTRLFHARQAVIAAVGTFSQPINPVVFPATMVHEQGILVYLLAASSRDNTVVFGRHYRARTSDDGTKVLEVEPLSNSALELPLNPELPPGAVPVGLTVTQILTDYPVETHVFASMLHHQPVYVGTSRGIWKVDGDRVSFVGQKP
jgi:hypothetical protein